MNWFNDLPRIYLHRAPVDFRKAVNGLSEVVAQELSMNLFDESLYVPQGQASRCFVIAGAIS